MKHDIITAKVLQVVLFPGKPQHDNKNSLIPPSAVCQKHICKKPNWFNLVNRRAFMRASGSINSQLILHNYLRGRDVFQECPHRVRTDNGENAKRRCLKLTLWLPYIMVNRLQRSCAYAWACTNVGKYICTYTLRDNSSNLSRNTACCLPPPPSFRYLFWCYLLLEQLYCVPPPPDHSRWLDVYT